MSEKMNLKKLVKKTKKTKTCRYEVKTILQDCLISVVLNKNNISPTRQH